MPLFVEYVEESDGTSWMNVRTTAEEKPALFSSVSKTRIAEVFDRWSHLANITSQHVKVPVKPDSSVVCIPMGGTDVEVATTTASGRTHLDTCGAAEDEFVRDLLAHALDDLEACRRGHRPDEEAGQVLIACLHDPNMRRHYAP